MNNNVTSMHDLTTIISNLLQHVEIVRNVLSRHKEAPELARPALFSQQAPSVLAKNQTETINLAR